MKRLKRNFERGEIDKKTYAEKATEMIIVHLESINYKYIRKLADGSFGVVLELKNRQSDSKVAAKIVPEENASKGELDIWPKLVHENIVPQLELVRQMHKCVFLMPSYPTALDDKLKQPSFLSDESGHKKAISWIKDVTKGINYIHQNGYCHLNLRTDNILITDCNEAKICSFRHLTSSEPIYRDEIHPVFRPPETENTYGEITPIDGQKVDIWTLGMLSLEIFTGQSLSRKVSKWNFRDISWFCLMYRPIYDTLQRERFEKLMKGAFPCSEGVADKVDHVVTFITSCLILSPQDRPSARGILSHHLLGGSIEKYLPSHGIPDIWSKREHSVDVKLLMMRNRNRASREDIESLDKRSLMERVDAVMNHNISDTSLYVTGPTKMSVMKKCKPHFEESISEKLDSTDYNENLVVEQEAYLVKDKTAEDLNSKNRVQNESIERGDSLDSNQSTDSLNETKTNEITSEVQCSLEFNHIKVLSEENVDVIAIEDEYAYNFNENAKNLNDDNLDEITTLVNYTPGFNQSTENLDEIIFEEESLPDFNQIIKDLSDENVDVVTIEDKYAYNFSPNARNLNENILDEEASLVDCSPDFNQSIESLNETNPDEIIVEEKGSQDFNQIFKKLSEENVDIIAIDDKYAYNFRQNNENLNDENLDEISSTEEYSPDSTQSSENLDEVTFIEKYTPDSIKSTENSSKINLDKIIVEDENVSQFRQDARYSQNNNLDNITSSGKYDPNSNESESDVDDKNASYASNFRQDARNSQNNNLDKITSSGKYDPNSNESESDVDDKNASYASNFRQGARNSQNNNLDKITSSGKYDPNSNESESDVDEIDFDTESDVEASDFNQRPNSVDINQIIPVLSNDPRFNQNTSEDLLVNTSKTNLDKRFVVKKDKKDNSESPKKSSATSIIQSMVEHKKSSKNKNENKYAENDNQSIVMKKHLNAIPNTRRKVTRLHKSILNQNTFAKTNSSSVRETSQKASDAQNIKRRTNTTENTSKFNENVPGNLIRKITSTNIPVTQKTENIDRIVTENKDIANVNQTPKKNLHYQKQTTDLGTKPSSSKGIKQSLKSDAMQNFPKKPDTESSKGSSVTDIKSSESPNLSQTIVKHHISRKLKSKNMFIENFQKPENLNKSVLKQAHATNLNKSALQKTDSSHIRETLPKKPDAESIKQRNFETKHPSKFYVSSTRNPNRKNRSKTREKKDEFINQDMTEKKDVLNVNQKEPTSLSFNRKTKDMDRKLTSSKFAGDRIDYEVLEPGEIPVYLKDRAKLSKLLERTYPVVSFESMFKDNDEEVEEGEIVPDSGDSNPNTQPRRPEQKKKSRSGSGSQKIKSWWKSKQTRFPSF